MLGGRHSGRSGLGLKWAALDYLRKVTCKIPGHKEVMQMAGRFQSKMRKMKPLSFACISSSGFPIPKIVLVPFSLNSFIFEFLQEKLILPILSKIFNFSVFQIFDFFTFQNFRYFAVQNFKNSLLVRKSQTASI